MIPILYATISEGSVPNHFGIGSLTDCLSAKVTEERNGIYEIVLEYASGGIHAEEILVDRFIMAKPNFTDDPQIFRIYKVGKVMEGRFTVYGQHISYDLSGKICPSGTSGGSATASVLALTTNGGGNFNITTNIVSSKPFKVDVPSSTRSWFGGKEGSLLDIYGGEWKYDNYTCSLLSARGQDRGVQIRYGKNLTQLSQELDMSNLVTGVYGYAVNSETGTVTTSSKVSTGLSLDVPRDIAVDFSNDVDWESSTAIATQLATLTGNYVTSNSSALINIRNSITLDFVQLKDLQDRVDLCDTVSIFFEALGISASVKCIKTEWDVLEERYSKTTFGDARTNIADTISSQGKKLEIVPTSSEVAMAVDRATELITGNLGGYVVLHDSNGDGYPDEVLIMDTADISTAQKLWRWNKSGLGYSSTGYSGTYGTAITQEGQIVANYVSTGVLNADLIKAGTISDANGNSTINMTTGVATLKDMKAKNRFTFIDTNNVERAIIGYSSDDGTTLRAKASNGKILASVDGMPSGYGQVTLGNSSGTYMVYLSALTNGGALTLKNSSANNTVVLATDSSGGYLSLNNSSGTQVTRISSNGSINAVSGQFSVFPSTYGCAIQVYNNNNSINTNIFSGSSGQALFYLGDGSGTDNIKQNGGTGNITCVSLTQTSSRKVKENIKPIEDAEKILELQAVSFDYKNKELGSDRRGFVAEEVAEVLPNLVSDGDVPSLDYVAMIPYLQDVIKKQEERIKALEDKIYGSN